jgi:hypothetical protein
VLTEEWRKIADIVGSDIDANINVPCFALSIFPEL